MCIIPSDKSATLHLKHITFKRINNTSVLKGKVTIKLL